MDIQIKGKGRMSLSQSDFRAAGGEGSVYVKGGLAYKLYTDRTKMLPMGKIQDLSAITHKDIIVPQDIVLDIILNTPVGYTMRAVPKSLSLCQMFPKAFRDRVGLTPGMSNSLVSNLRELIEHIHSANCLVVDLNEMNFLISEALDKIYAIDTDSYQTPKFPATAIMDSIRDRHCKNNLFTKDTDWFSFAILSFMMFVGIHPYKGKHAVLKTLDDRMLSNVSVMNDAVTVPPACYPLDVIPENYRSWYREVFEEGRRCAPPEIMGAVSQPIKKATIISGTGIVDIQEIADFEDNVITCVEDYVLTESALWRNTKKVSTFKKTKSYMGILPSGFPVIAEVDSGYLELYDLALNPIAVNMLANNVVTYDGKIFVQQDSKMLEVDFFEGPSKKIASGKWVANILPSSVQVFDGAVVQSIFGSMYAGSPKSITRIPELDGQRIIDAKARGNVLVVIGFSGGKYTRFIMRFSADNKSYDVRKVAVDSYVGINYALLDSGVVVLMNEEDNLELFSANKETSSTSYKVVLDPGIDGSFTLFAKGAQLFAYKDSKVYKLSLKK